jgi:hypothetical protein
MDIIRHIWVESGSRSSSFEGGGGVSGSSEGPSPPTGTTTAAVFNSRPPPLRTSSTYDDDETFTNVALNLLSRFECLHLTTREAILSALISPQQRASFLDGICLRLDRASHLSPKTLSLVHSLERLLGRELRDMVYAEANINGEQPCCYTTKPVTPRHTAQNQHHHPHQSTSMSSTMTCRSNTKKSRRFFPDCDSFFLGGRKRRVQNIDWKLAEAVQQVENLRLDGSSPSPSPPPPPTNSYVPPPPPQQQHHFHSGY